MRNLIARAYVDREKAVVQSALEKSSMGESGDPWTSQTWEQESRTRYLKRPKGRGISWTAGTTGRPCMGVSVGSQALGRN